LTGTRCGLAGAIRRTGRGGGRSGRLTAALVGVQVALSVVLLVGSGLFSFYVSNFGNYNETYGSVGAIVILLTWFYLTAYVVLLGAELNAEMEHQTKEDTTIGEPEPLGERRAYVADTIGKAYGDKGRDNTDDSRQHPRR
ncbi:MAG: YihY/virulence factor BrkB family protein, partial [Methylocaldum sp.]|nr:YihY/virulence factor BrkB family protein [Methylocaldum sp.]